MSQGYQGIGRQCEIITARIKRLPNIAQVAIAVSAAQRLMDEHMNRSEERRDQFALGWAPVLSLLWQALSAPTAETD